MTAPPAVRGIRAAFVFLTRIPLGGFPYDDRAWAWASAHFPLVGLALGAIAGAIDRALLPLGATAAAILALAAAMLLTGGFHEDGLADTADALGGAYDRAKLFVILKDSRIGSFGACALIASLVARTALIARTGEAALWCLPLVGCVARVVPVIQLVALPYVTSDPESRSRVVTRTGGIQAVVAGGWGVAAMAGFASLGHASFTRVIVLAGVLAALGGVTAWRYVVRAGGLTGDFLGATEQLAEVAALAVLAWP